MTTSKHHVFLLDEWRVEPALNRLVTGETTRRLTPKTMEVLLCLVAGAGGVVTRDELLAAVWPDTHIGEEVLTRAISDLRTVLGDDRRKPRFVETIPKVGYRLVASVSWPKPSIDAPEAADPQPPPGTPRQAWPVLVPVLVFAAIAVWLALDRPRAPATAAGIAASPMQATRLTAMAGFESFAEMAPDGRWVAFSHFQPGASLDLYIVSSAGGEPRRLTQGPPQDLGATWSPDGLRIAFERHEQDALERCAIMEIPAVGGPERRIGSCGKNVAGDLAWSPSGEWLAFSDRDHDDEPFGIYLLSTIDGSRRKLVAPDGEHWGDRDPVFSPDGRQVAFTRSVSMATQDVFRLAIDGGEPIPVTRDGRSVQGHSWAPDGAALFVSSRRTGARGLWRFALDDSAPTWLPIAIDHAWRPTVGRAAKSPLIFEQRELQVGILRGTIDSDAKEPATPWLEATAEDLDPRHAPDGTRIAFASNRSGPFEIWIAKADGTSPLQLTSLGGSFTGSPQWSPDGTSVVFDTRLDGHADIYRVSADGNPSVGEPFERLTEDHANDLAPSFSADGSIIYFGSNRTGRWQIWRTPAAGGPREQVTTDGGYRALASSDGETLYLTRYGNPGLFRHALETGTTAPVPGTEHLVSAAHWTLVGATLYLLADPPGPGGLVLLRQRPGSAFEEIEDLGPMSLMSGFSVAPDERSMLYPQITRLESNLWRLCPVLFDDEDILGYTADGTFDGGRDRVTRGGARSRD